MLVQQTLPWIAEPDKMAAMCRWECAQGCASSMGDDHMAECVDTEADEVPEPTKPAVCRWCLQPASHPRHDFDDPENHASAKHFFDQH